MTAFRRDEALERLLTLKARQPDVYDRLPAIRKLTVGYYVAARDAAEHNDQPPPAA